MSIEQVRELLGAAATMLGFVGAVLVLALADVGMTLLLLRWAGKLKDLAQPEPSTMAPELPEEAGIAVVIGGGIRRWQ